MARLEEKIKKEEILEVGDIIISDHYPARYIINLNDKYYAVDIKNGSIRGISDSIEEVFKFYACEGYRIIKSKNIVMKEI